MGLSLVPATITEARRLVSRWHSHLPTPPKGGRFALAVMDDEGEIHGVALVGHGARLVSDRWTSTVTRVATDRTPNACSMLYGGVARSWRAMGGRQLITYTLDHESGTALKAAGWVPDGWSGGGSWDRPSRPRPDPAEAGPKQRWRSR